VVDHCSIDLFNFHDRLAVVLDFGLQRGRIGLKRAVDLVGVAHKNVGETLLYVIAEEDPLSIGRWLLAGNFLNFLSQDDLHVIGDLLAIACKTLVL
jgi:hypothetical protein